MVYPPEVIHRLPKCRTDGAVFFAHFAALCRITICIDDIQMGAFTLEITQLWNDACDILRNEITEVSYNTFIKSALTPVELRGDTCVLQAATDFYHNFVSKRYGPLLEAALTQAASRPLHVKLLTPAEGESYKSAPADVQPLPAFLNPKYTFDSFVVGNSNRFAHAACLAVAEAPAEAYNPLFIYGGVGLGKTHLMNAISHFIVKENPKSRILFTTSENFTNEVVEAIARKKTMELRNRMRSVDVLLIDDVQFLSNKQATQEEFFHTFNALFENGKQIVLSSDRPPHEIAMLEARMRSRFLSGLVVDVQKPDYETRVAILMRLAETNHIAIGAGAISYIAEQIDTNIRELEGSLIRVTALAQLEGMPITEQLAQKALESLIVKKEKTAISPEKIMDEVAARYGIRRDDILSTRRNRDVAVPRQLAIYLTRELAQLSTTRIGDAFGRDHSTIMHACRKTADSIAGDKEFARIVDELTRAIMEK